MTIARPLSLFAVSITLAALTVALGPGDAQAKIKCNSILGPGGTYVLDRNLTCPQVDKPGTSHWERIGVLRVIGGATLNLNGHTVSCDPRYTGPDSALGIVAVSSTVKNGTVRGCVAGILPSNSVVKGMTLDANGTGVMMIEKYQCCNNLIIGNTAKNNRLGFRMQETVGETLIDNIAQDNDVGFSIEQSDVVLIGNVALRNRLSGFRTDGPGLFELTRLSGNRAEQNGGEGFWIGRVGEITGNIAKNNGGAGFVVDELSAARLDRMHDNVARANGGDGFQLLLRNGGPPGTLSRNSAINNQGYGLHVVDGFGYPPGAPTVTITGNTVMRNGAGDLADDTDCRYVLWGSNRFGTAAQPCIQ